MESFGKRKTGLIIEEVGRTYYGELIQERRREAQFQTGRARRARNTKILKVG